MKSDAFTIRLLAGCAVIMSCISVPFFVYEAGHSMLVVVIAAVFGWLVAYLYADEMGWTLRDLLRKKPGQGID